VKRSTIGRVRIECQRCGKWAEIKLARYRSSGTDYGHMHGWRGCGCRRNGANVASASFSPFMLAPGRTKHWDGILYFRMPHAPRPA